MTEPRYSIGERVEIQVPRCDTEPNFDRACEQAHMQAYCLFGFDSGHLTNVKDSERSTDCVAVEFKRYVSIGSTHYYFFETWVERDEQEED